MTNYVEFNDRIAFHPGYYIKELVDESGLTQEDFAKRLDTTPKNLSLLVRGEQNLSIDIAMKLSRMIGTSVSYWLNLQNEYDSLIAEFKSEEELLKEQQIFDHLDYHYFLENFGLPELPPKRDVQIKQIREFLNVSTLSVFKKQDMAVSFRNSINELSEANIIKANIMVQIATNITLKTDAPKFNKKKFEEAIQYALTLTRNHSEFYPLIYQAFLKAGVVFIILPNFAGSKTNGATKKIGNHVMLMVNDCRLYADSFWFTLFHEIGHVIHGDYGISFEKENGEQEKTANKYAEDMLIPPNQYKNFLSHKDFSLLSVEAFAEQINRDPGIVVGRLKNDKYIDFNDYSTKTLRHKYKIEPITN